MKHTQRLTAVGASFALLAAAVTVPAHAAPTGDGIVINEAYTNAGSANAVFRNKFVELYNPTDAPVSLDGWSLQYRSATGTANPSSVVPLSGTIPARGHYLIQGGSNGDNGEVLPTADIVSGVNVSGTRGTIVLSNQSSVITDLGTGSVTDHDAVVDLIGYGDTNTFETAAAAAPSANSDPKSINRTDGVDSDDNSADFSLSAQVSPTNAAGESATPPEEPEPPVDPEPTVLSIAQIQGTGDTTPVAGQTVTTEGVVTALYSTGGFNGYYLQTEGTGGAQDSTPGASDGIFVYSPATVSQVSMGELVQVTGTAAEHYGMTQISVPATGLAPVDRDPQPVQPTELAFPLTEAEREAHEGMKIAPAGDWTITDNYSLNQYGSLGLTPGTEPLKNPTSVAAPGAPAQAVAAENAAKTMVLDDGASINFMRSPGNQNTLPYVNADDPVRVGSAVEFTTPVILDYRFDAWGFQPLTHLTDETPAELQPAAFENTRLGEEAPKDVGGTASVATFNVLNYFTTLGDQYPDCRYYSDREGNPITTNYCEPRGAYNQENLQRQQDKLVAAINGLDASVVGLEEIENAAKFGHDRDRALSTLVEALNAAAGSEKWAFVPSPAEQPTLASQDVIRNAFIYQPDDVTPVGDSVLLDDQVAFSNAREPLAQTFEAAGGDESTRFIAITNHFKSKGGSGATGGNADSGDGQGSYNADRVKQAEALVAFADQLSASSGVEKVILMGDFNSYEKEDPIKVLEDAGYVSQGAATGEYTYAFGGAVGSLDGIFTNQAATAQVTGADIWNINAFEPIIFEYSRFNYTAEQLYAADQWRSSDHDPLKVGLKLVSGPTIPEEPAPVCETPDFSDNAPGSQFYAPVRWLQCEGFANGHTDGTYRKSADIKRGETLGLIYRYLAPEHTAPATSPFTDVATDDTFFGPITWAAAEGVTTGYTDETFRPYRPVSRGEFASFLYRAVDPEHTAPASSEFGDVSTTSAHYQAITWLTAEGITTGYRDGTFRPNQPVTRGEVAAFLHRYDTAVAEAAAEASSQD